MGINKHFQRKVDIRLNTLPEKQIDIDSDIDWKIIDQLHNAVLNFSKNSMQTKKIMFSLLGLFVAAMLQVPTMCDVVKWFPIIIGIVVLFWFFDSQTYYYQEKLRASMDTRFESLRKRYPGKNDDEYTLPQDRHHKHRVWRSIFNYSVLFYPLIIFIVAICWVLICKGIIV